MIDLKQLTTAMIRVHEQADLAERNAKSLWTLGDELQQAILAELRARVNILPGDELYVSARPCSDSLTGTCVLHLDHYCVFCKKPDDNSV